MLLEVVNVIAPSDQEEAYHQNIVRVIDDNEGLRFQIAFKMPSRLFDDNKEISEKQRSTIDGFFFGNRIAPIDGGWQQASSIISMRLLAYAVAQTLEEGFLAANRILIAPFIAAYISQQPYLCAVARGWSLATWEKVPVQSMDSKNRQSAAWLALITSPFYRELFTFAHLATQDIYNACTDLNIYPDDLDLGNHEQ